MYQDIYIIEDSGYIYNKLKNIFKEEKDYLLRKIETEQLEDAIKNIPDLIIINEDGIQEDIINICQKVRKDNDNSITLVIKILILK